MQNFHSLDLIYNRHQSTTTLASLYMQLVSDMLESPTMSMFMIAGGLIFLVIMAFVFVITRRLLFTGATRGWLV